MRVGLCLVSPTLAIITVLYRGTNLAKLIPSPYFVNYGTWKFKFALYFCWPILTWTNCESESSWVESESESESMRPESESKSCSEVRVHRFVFWVRVRVHKGRVRTVRTFSGLGLGLTHWVRVRVRSDSLQHCFEQQTSLTLCSVLYLVHPKIKFHISNLWPAQIWHVCCSEKEKKKG